MRVAFRFALGYALLSFTYSIYYTVSRPLYGVDVYGRSFVLFIAGAEYIPAVFSFLIGSLSDSIGRRRFMLFSIMGAAPLALIFLQREPLPLLLSISLYSFFNGLASMIGLSSVLESRKDVGRNYSVIGLASSLGWAGGSSIAWLLYKGLGEKLFVALLVLAYLFGLYGLYSGYAGKEREAMGSVLGGLRTVYNRKPRPSGRRWICGFISLYVYYVLSAVCLVKLRCPSCGHVWDYKGKRMYYTICPNCHRSVHIARCRVE
jgi:MFS family permease